MRLRRHQSQARVTCFRLGFATAFVVDGLSWTFRKSNELLRVENIQKLIEEPSLAEKARYGRFLEDGRRTVEQEKASLRELSGSVLAGIVTDTARSDSSDTVLVHLEIVVDGFEALLTDATVLR